MNIPFKLSGWMESPVVQLKQQYIRYKSRVDLLYRYITGQGLVQVFNVLNGFFLLRWLSINEQAKFSMAMGIMATLGILGDLGFGGSLIGLIGNRTNDKVLIGQYIRGIQYYKNRLLIISLSIGVLLVTYYNQQQQWGLDFWIIYALILISVQAQSMVGYYSAVLQMKQNLRDYYKPLVTSSAVRLMITFLLFKLTDLSAVEVVSMTTLSFVFNAWWMKRSAKLYYTRAPFKDSSITHDILKTIKPVILMVLFYAIQGQLTILIAGLLGKTQSIAEIGALSRLGQLFAILTPFNTIVLTPYFARSNTGQLVGRFFKIILIAVAVVTPIVLIGFLYPTFFLWLLGSKYYSLETNVGLYILASAIWYLSSIVWSINTAKKWNKPHTSFLYVAVVVAIQVACILSLDLSHTSQLIQLSLYLSCGTVGCYSFTSLLGFYKDRKLTDVKSELLLTNKFMN